MKEVAMLSTFVIVTFLILLTTNLPSYHYVVSGFVLPTSGQNHRSLTRQIHSRGDGFTYSTSRRRKRSSLSLPLTKFESGDFFRKRKLKSSNSQSDYIEKGGDPSWDPSSDDDGDDDDDEEEEEVAMSPICRIVTRADARLPSSPRIIPSSLQEKPFLLDKLDAYFHAQGRRQTSDLKYLHRSVPEETKDEDEEDNYDEEAVELEEKKLVSATRSSLENAGFQLLSKRDIDLCDSLNAAYLLRLSIRPDLSKLAPIENEFYPERYNLTTGNVLDENEQLFDGRILVYWRSYSKEATKGRLILPKLDYLQANLVQRFAAWINRGLGRYERKFNEKVYTQKSTIKKSMKESFSASVDSIRNWKVSKFIKEVILQKADDIESLLRDDENRTGKNLDDSSEGSIKLGRYGGSRASFFGSPDPNDALDPFLMCEVQYYKPSELPSNLRFNGTDIIDLSQKVTAANAESDMNKVLNHQGFTCEYDAQENAMTAATATADAGSNEDQPPPSASPPKLQLLERVSIGNLVDVFSKSGRKKFIKTLFSESELVEPTYEEVSGCVFIFSG